MNIKIINAGYCMLCGRNIKIVTNKGNNKKYTDIFFCPKCERRREMIDKPQESEGRINDTNK